VPHSSDALPKHVLIAGVSTRAAAESAALAGFIATAIDAFVDLDQHPSVRAVSPPGTYSTQGAARAASEIECDAVVYVSGFENHPGAVTTLTAGRALWGNSPDVLARVRDPMVVAQTFRARGHAVPAVSLRAGTEAGVGRWLVKPLDAGGGHGVRLWQHGQRLPDRCYLQDLVDGIPGSVVFVAAGGRAVPLGVSRQLIGERAFGAAGYQYCGNVLEPATTDEGVELIHAACALADAAAEEFDLVGVNGIDFVAHGRVPYPVEVNPRWCASLELVERSYGLSVFAAHAGACATGALPDFDLIGARRDKGAAGKAVVFATRDLTVGDTEEWLGDSIEPSIRDVPRSGERIRAGRPVCTVFAAGHDGDSCRAALERRAREVYADLAVWDEARPEA
jgi:predicted ATP-grasp superfamily ATP-dependent carboligase